MTQMEYERGTAILQGLVDSFVVGWCSHILWMLLVGSVSLVGAVGCAALGVIVASALWAPRLIELARLPNPGSKVWFTVNQDRILLEGEVTDITFNQWGDPSVWVKVQREAGGVVEVYSQPAWEVFPVEGS